MDSVNSCQTKSAASKRNVWQRYVSHHRHLSTDSGASSDLEYIKSTMSSCESDRSDSRRQASWSSSNYSFSDSMPSSDSRDYSTGGSSRSTESTGNLQKSASFDNTYGGGCCSMLPELTQVPWTEDDVLSVLQKGQLKDCCGNISIECLQRLTYLLQRPLIRIAREAQRFSELYNKCSKHDIMLASKLILSPRLFAESNKLAAQCTLHYSMTAKNVHCSKSSLCSLALSIGKHQRWCVEALTARYTHELAAVYLTATMESLIEQTACLAFLQESTAEMMLKQSTVLTTDMLEAGIQRNPDLHTLYHPFSHLVSTVGNVSDLATTLKSLSGKHKLGSTVGKTIEKNLTAKCVSSVAELADVVSQSMHYSCQRSTKNSNSKWSSSAMDTLYYFMKCSQADCCESRCSLIGIKMESRGPNTPPAAVWVRLAATFAEHRMDLVVDGDDVMQAARILLPGMNCPVRNSRYMYTDSAIEFTNTSAADICRQFGLSLLCSRMPELKKCANSLINKTDIDHFNDQGLTALMCACAKGDEPTTLALLKAGASTEKLVLAGHPSCSGWTPLCFAVSNGHLGIAKLLLEHGCSAEGSAIEHGNVSETPLQLACASGQLGLVSLLLEKNADPYQPTLVQPGLEVKNVFNSFTLAASHGRRDILRYLFSDTLKVSGSKLLTLSEVLAESCDVAACNGQLDRTFQKQLHVEEENEYMVIENDYVTIEEVMQPDQTLSQLENKTSSGHIHTLQLAMFQAAESGFLDLALELHSTGLPWTLHIWYTSLSTAYVTQRKAIVQSLLREFSSLGALGNTQLLTQSCLPLMFHIFRDSKNEMVSKQLAVIFSTLYGAQPLPLLKDARSCPSPVTKSSYLNSRELADVGFIVEGRVFYAHRVILASASMRFKSMLASCADVAMPEIAIGDIDYDTFERVMRYIYEGVCCIKFGGSTDLKPVKHLLGAAHYFQLDGLKRKCEIMLSKNLTIDNCVSIYKAAKMYLCVDLMEICEAYFLQHLDRLLTRSDKFKRILYSAKVHNRELMDRLSSALATRLCARGTAGKALTKAVSL